MHVHGLPRGVVASGYGIGVEIAPIERDAGDLCFVVPSDSKRLPCDVCGHPMEPEHAHYRCPSCHYILPCCGW